jgi:hypothetical protein
MGKDTQLAYGRIKMADALTRLEFLKETHRKLDEDIKKGYSCFLNDDKLNMMKVQKLRYKEQIEKLEKEIGDEVRPS